MTDQAKIFVITWQLVGAAVVRLLIAGFDPLTAACVGGAAAGLWHLNRRAWA